MKTIINKADMDYKNVKNKCRTTINKKHSEKEATPEFKENILISEHTPIRLMQIDFKWSNIKSWIATHFSRHFWTPFISTQREDKTGVSRDDKPQGALVDMEVLANPQNLIDVSRKRLCFASHPKTRAYALDLKVTLMNMEDTKELGRVLVPNCIYRCGCPEVFQNDCSYFSTFTNKHQDLDLFDIKTRYRAYNNYIMSEVLSLIRDNVLEETK